MRNLPYLLIALAFSACESKKPATPAEDEYPPVPTMSAAPGSKPAPKVIVPPELPPPVEEVRDEEPPSDDAPAEPPPQKSSARRSSGSVDGIGSVGSGSAGSGSGSGSVGELLEASAPDGWTVEIVSTDGDQNLTRRTLRQRQKAFARCLSFVKEGNSLRAIVTVDAGTASKVVTWPPNDTAAQCLRTQIANDKFVGASSMTLMFRR